MAHQMFRVLNKLLLVGQAPGKRGDPRKPLLGVGSGDRLAKLAGLSRAEYARAFDRVNLYYERPERFRSQTDFRRALRLVPRIRFRHAILLGRVAAAAFGLGFEPPFVWIHASESSLAWMPHPSGLNRWFNDAKNRRQASRFLRQALRSTNAAYHRRATRTQPSP